MKMLLLIVATAFALGSYLGAVTRAMEAAAAAPTAVEARW